MQTVNEIKPTSLLCEARASKSSWFVLHGAILSFLHGASHASVSALAPPHAAFFTFTCYMVRYNFIHSVN